MEYMTIYHLILEENQVHYCSKVKLIFIGYDQKGDCYEETTKKEREEFCWCWHNTENVGDQILTDCFLALLSKDQGARPYLEHCTLQCQAWLMLQCSLEGRWSYCLCYQHPLRFHCPTWLDCGNYETDYGPPWSIDFG